MRQSEILKIVEPLYALGLPTFAHAAAVALAAWDDFPGYKETIIEKIGRKDYNFPVELTKDITRVALMVAQSAALRTAKAAMPPGGVNPNRKNGKS